MDPFSPPPPSLLFLVSLPAALPLLFHVSLPCRPSPSLPSPVAAVAQWRAGLRRLEATVAVVARRAAAARARGGREHGGGIQHGEASMAAFFVFFI